jgi:hypothetical protein
MKLKTTFLLMILLIIAIKSYSQVTVTIENVLVNNQTNVNNCNTIDFGTISTNSLNFNFKLSKNSSFTPNGNLKIMLKYSSSTNGSERANLTFQSTSWSFDGTSAEGYISCNISASEIQVSGSSIYLEYTANGTNYISCTHPLIKTPTPTFLLVPTYVNMLCNSTSAKTFTVNNIYDSQGTLSYSWNVGNGWKQNGVPVSGTFITTTNSITLEPVSGTVLPSNVSVTTTLDGVQYGTNTSPVTRSDILQTITSILGTSTLCSGNTNYNFGTENVLTGQTVTWSLSNNTVATLSNASNMGVTLNQIGNGAVTLTATISNGCGQSYSKSKNLFGGTPPAFAVARGLAEDENCDTKYHYVPFTIANSSSLLNYNFTVFGFPPSTYQGVNYNGHHILRFSKSFSGWIEFSVSASNGCGTTYTYREAYIDNCSSIPYSSQLRSSEPVSVFKVYPNPSNDVVYLNLVDTNNIPEKNAQIKAVLYDMLGFEKKNIKVKDNKAVIGMSDLTSGLYVLKVSINGETETHLISRK